MSDVGPLVGPSHIFYCWSQKELGTGITHDYLSSSIELPELKDGNASGAATSTRRWRPSPKEVSPITKEVATITKEVANLTKVVATNATCKLIFLYMKLPSSHHGPSGVALTAEKVH